MKATIHGYTTGRFFSATAQVYSWVATVSAFFAILNGSYVAFLFLPAGIVSLLLYRRFEIDLVHRTYKVGVRLLGFTFGKLLPLPGVDFLYLNKNKRTSVAMSRASVRQFRSITYDGYLKLADATKLHLVQEHTKEKALQKLEQIADDLGIVLRDQTDRKF
ncbi:hypothetical protein [Pontibacter fetidus]|uniref:Uncharacterized protein n=1 Tax=Pontibacter fetidus TaxID=2700082 RepID=A0A6B2HA83_9BACT|nr:hypothetical protein [Pontibacter fetidus]NDK57190.1 hypothetical protein [Pontibacter fetidus]